MGLLLMLSGGPIEAALARGSALSAARLAGAFALSNKQPKAEGRRVFVYKLFLYFHIFSINGAKFSFYSSLRDNKNHGRSLKK